MGNFFDTEGNQNGTNNTRQVRSWADVTAEVTRTGHRHLQRVHSETSIEARLKPKVKKPLKVKKLLSLLADTVTIKQNENSDHIICFSYDASLNGIGMLLIKDSSGVEEIIEEIELLSGLKSTAEFTLLKKNFQSEQKLSIVLKPKELKEEAIHTIAEKETSNFELKQKEQSLITIELRQQSIQFNGQEFVYKTLFGTKEKDSSEDSTLCVICLENERSTIISPCLHKCLCKDCAKQLSKSKANCPLCRTLVAEFWVVDSAKTTPSTSKIN